jgi:site-specific DNA-methyltransferase (adenine-specific)
MISEVFLGDCMDFMRDLPDNFADLALVDPPYGIGEDGGKCRTRGSKKTNGKKGKWDNETPPAGYFNELFRVSKNQIIFGGNYFTDKLPVSRCWLYWQKELGGDFADGELLWTSFDEVLRQYKKRSETFDRIHPTQKPVQLYKWLLKNYAKEGDKILDTHLGSQSSRIACYEGGFDFWGYELDKEYFDAGNKRFEIYKSQLRLIFPLK